jgi:hypothetical protein
MNFIEKIGSVKKDLSNLQVVLYEIRALLNNAKNEVKIAGKTLRKANVEQPALFGYYDEIRVHLQHLSDFVEIQILRRKAQVLKYISENSQMDFGERVREKLVDDDPEYVDLRIKKLEVEEVLEMTKSICKRFEQRGYTLNNISKLVVAQSQDEHLIMNDNDD